MERRDPYPSLDLDEMRAYARKKQQLRAAAEADGTLVDRSLPVLYSNNDDCDGYEDW